MNSAGGKHHYWYKDAKPNPAHAYLWPAIKEIIARQGIVGRALDLGCGNGSTAQMLHEQGLDVVGIDPSKSGISRAKEAYPHISFYEASAYEDLSKTHGQFTLVVSLEVIEHLLYPSQLCSVVYNLLSEGGLGIVSTPYHGYIKNIAIAVSGRWDQHHNPTHEGGHIKFFSAKTLGKLLTEAGFRNIGFKRVGRVPLLARSLVAIARK
jgi:2-polyprenyl-6-hydroxyphenyl methylase/3-demethylubiquinone-9 3-methyltransferase